MAVPKDFPNTVSAHWTVRLGRKKRNRSTIGISKSFTSYRTSSRRCSRLNSGAKALRNLTKCRCTWLTTRITGATQDQRASAVWRTTVRLLAMGSQRRKGVQATTRQTCSILVTWALIRKSERSKTGSAISLTRWKRIVSLSEDQSTILYCRLMTVPMLTLARS